MEMPRRTPPFRLGMEISVLIHGAVFLALVHRPDGLDFAPSWATSATLEVDLTRPHRLTADPRKAYRSPHPGTGAPRVENPTPEPFKSGGGIATRGTAWTLPTDATKILETPTESGNPLATSTGPATGLGTAEGESRGLGGWGTGGEGEVDWIYLTERPRLLNKDEVLKNMLRYYPFAEKQAQREGRVLVDVHINTNGAVSGVDIKSSAGSLFDEAAKKVLSLARFSPARAGEQTVAVKMPQTLDFKLEE